MVQHNISRGMEAKGIGIEPGEGACFKGTTFARERPTPTEGGKHEEDKLDVPR
jgi:hypothetical protein